MERPKNEKGAVVGAPLECSSLGSEQNNFSKALTVDDLKDRIRAAIGEYLDRGNSDFGARRIRTMGDALRKGRP